jgi:undecaprenyl diphosphate synthase
LRGKIAKMQGTGSYLLQQINSSTLPAHIAVIMDGNGRWAKKRGLPRVAGHRSGVNAVREIVEASAELGISVLTLYAFSVENWKRPPAEVRTLMTLLKEYLHREVDNLDRNNIRFRTIGRTDGLDASVRFEINKAVTQTQANTGMIFVVALNYGGRAEIIDTVNQLLATRHPGQGPITEAEFGRALYTSGLPDPDLLIRTSGEMRVSNFLLWQIAYSEMYVTDTLWPDFSRKDLYEAILSFQKRERRFGGLVEAPVLSIAKK